MSAGSQRLLRQRQRYRNLRGEYVLFGGVNYKVLVEAVSGANAGQQGLPNRSTYSIFLASTDPSVFDFNPLDFAPNTTVTPPIEGDEFTRNNLIYVVASTRYENEDTDTIGFMCECLRKIWLAPVSA